MSHSTAQNIYLQISMSLFFVVVAKWVFRNSVIIEITKPEHMANISLADVKHWIKVHTMCHHLFVSSFYRRIRWNNSSVVQTFCLPLWPASRNLPYRQIQCWPGRAFWLQWLSLWRMSTPLPSWGITRGKSWRWTVAFLWLSPFSLLAFLPKGSQDFVSDRATFCFSV